MGITICVLFYSSCFQKHESLLSLHRDTGAGLITLSIVTVTCTVIIIIIFKFIYLFIFGCVGSSFLREGFLWLRRAGATLHRGARASHRRGLSCCGAQAPDAQAQQLRLTGLVAPWHVGSSQTRARTRVPCICRQTLNHCATREALHFHYYYQYPQS